MSDTPPAAPTAPTAAQVGHLVFVLGLAGFSSALTTRALDPLLVNVAADFNTTVERTALLASAFALPYALIQPILGPIGDALGKRLVMILCASLLVLALGFGALAPSLPMLFVARILAGAAAGGITPLALATFGDSVPMAERQVAMSRFMAWTIGGQVAGGALSGFLAVHLGWRGILAACGVVVLVGAVVLWRDSRRHPPRPPGASTFPSRSATTRASSPIPGRCASSPAWRRRGCWSSACSPSLPRFSTCAASAARRRPGWRSASSAWAASPMPAWRPCWSVASASRT